VRSGALASPVLLSRSFQKRDFYLVSKAFREGRSIHLLALQRGQEITSLDEHGDLLLDKMTESVYDKKMKHINTLLEYYLLHGKPMNEHESDHR